MNLDESQIVDKLNQFRRPRLGRILALIEKKRQFSSFLIWEFLIELYATMKIAVIQTESPVVCPALENLFGNLGKNLNLISSQKTFTGCLLQVQDAHRKLIALKFTSSHRAERIRIYARTASNFINTFNINELIKRFLVYEFQRLLEGELDIEREKRNLATMHKLAYDIPNVIVPKPLPQWETEHIVSMEWIEGTRLSSWTTYTPKDRSKLIEVIRAFHRRTVSEAGIFRYDNHWSNFILKSNGKLAIIDYGSVIDLDNFNSSASNTQLIINDKSAANTPSSRALAILACNWAEYYLNLISSRGFYTR